MSTQFESFVGIISLANKEISRIKGQEMGRMGLKGSDTMCLYYLKKHPEGITSAELARLIGVDRAAVSRILAHLGERGLVRSGGTKGCRGYRVPILLTERGMLAMRESDGVIDSVVNHAIEGVSPEDREAMYRALDAIVDNLGGIE